MKKWMVAAAIFAAGLMLTGCSSTTTSAAGSTSKSSVPAPVVTPTPTPTVTPTPKPVTTAAIADALQTTIPSITKIVEITEVNDTNNKIGRPNGYSQATTLYDSAATCDELGTDCGATLELWPNQAAAQDRSDYIQGIYKSRPALGSEYDYVHGGVILRVTGALKPSVASTYSAAFDAYFG